MSADKDPVIIQRRTLIARFMNRGYSSNEILELINTWLESQGELTVSLHTIKKDKAAIFKSWRLQHEHEIADARVEHIAMLQRLKRETWSAADDAKDRQGNRVGLLNLVRQIEMNLAKLDGSLARIEPQLTSDGEPFTFTLQLDNANALHR